MHDNHLSIAPSPMPSNVLTFEAPQELTLKNGLIVWDIKPKKPKNSYRISRPVIHNPEITEVRVYTEKLALGGAWQGEIIAPISTGATSKASHYRVKNIWLALIRHQLERNIKTKTYTFRIQSAFMVPLPEIVCLYQQNSLIVVEENAVTLNGSTFS